MVVSDKFKSSDDGFKYFIGYKEGKIVKQLFIILPQMTGYMKYFENRGKNVSVITKDDDVLDKCNKIWGKIKETLSIKFHSMPVNDEQYIKAKVREFNVVIKTNFLNNEVPKENKHYACIACITIDSVIRIRKKNYPQVYLQECKYKIKKTKMTNFIKAELESESESELESVIEFELKSELKTGTEQLSKQAGVFLGGRREAVLKTAVLKCIFGRSNLKSHVLKCIF